MMGPGPCTSATQVELRSSASDTEHSVAARPTTEGAAELLIAGMPMMDSACSRCQYLVRPTLSKEEALRRPLWPFARETRF